MSTGPGFLGLDRKAMEQERLARLGRKRPIENHAESNPCPNLETNDASKSISPPPKRIKSTTSDSSLAPPSTSGAIQFPFGVIKKTWAYGYDRGNDIKIEEVLQKSTLKTAVVSSYQLDFEWLSSKLDLTKSKLILIMHERDDERRAEWKRDAAQVSKSLRLCFPSLAAPYDCMHSKLMLLFHPSHLRIVIPSANAVPFDWGETGVMENSVFLIDLPRLEKEDHKEDQSAPTTFPTLFAKEIHRFLSAQEVDSDVLSGLHNFNFTNTKDLAFVHTIRGSQFGDAINTTGFPGLAQAVKRLGLDVPVAIPLDVNCTASSIGSLTEDQLETLYRAFRGRPPILPSASVIGKAIPGADEKRKLAERLKIFFPSQDTVKQSRGGSKNGGTIFLRPQYWAKDSFPREVFRDSLSQRAGLLSHCKIILARSASIAWAYVGSANLSQNAWGRLVWDRSTKSPKLSAGNWECGVLMPVRLPSEDDVSTASEGEEAEAFEVKDTQPNVSTLLPFDVFKKILDVPFQWPGIAYRKDQIPWCAGTVDAE